jgi:hypothetical protein
LSCILYEFGEVHSAKMFWDIIEMKFSVRGSKIVEAQINQDIVVENGDCMDNLVIEIQTEDGITKGTMINDESVSVVDNKASL